MHFSLKYEDAQKQSIITLPLRPASIQDIYFSSAAEELTTQEHSTQRENNNSSFTDYNTLFPL